MLSLGINADPRPPTSATPERIAASGARVVRMVLTPDFDLRPYIAWCRALRVEVLPVVVRESLPGWDPSWFYPDYLKALTEHYETLGKNVLWIQVGNEPDLSNELSPSSWEMSAAALNELLRAAHDLWPTTTLIGPGLASGDANYVLNVDRSLFHAIAVHCYGRVAPGSPLPVEYQPIEPLIQSYSQYGMPLYITEFGAPARDFDDQESRARYYVDIARYLSTRPDVHMALAFCLDDTMVPEFGLYQEGKPTPTASAFAAAAHELGGQPMMPPMTMTAPPDVENYIRTKTPELYPGLGQPWPIAAGPFAGQFIFPGWYDGMWVGIFTYGQVHYHGGEIWGYPTLNQPAMVAAGLNRPF